MGYLFGVKYLYGISSVTGMAPHTLFALIVLCLGVLSSRPREGFVGLMTSDAEGGSMTRLIVPLVLIVPLPLACVHRKVLIPNCVNA